MKQRKEISFRDQYLVCVKEGKIKVGKLQKFKDHLDMLPAFWHKAAPMIAAELKKNPNFGLKPLECLRFGGHCFSGNNACRKMRGLKPREDKLASFVKDSV
jgi:hypothetical protein